MLGFYFQRLVCLDNTILLHMASNDGFYFCIKLMNPKVNRTFSVDFDAGFLTLMKERHAKSHALIVDRSHFPMENTTGTELHRRKRIKPAC